MDDIVEIAADEILRQFDDADTAERRVIVQTAGGTYRESVRVHYADVPSIGGRPSGVARIALDVDPTRSRPAHEVRVLFDVPGHEDYGRAVAAAVLEFISPPSVETKIPHAIG